jgi:hypothetical protein
MMRRRHPLTLGAIVTAATVPLLAAGCGGGLQAGARIGSSSTTAVTTAGNRLVAYSDCMRTERVPNFPEPNRSGRIPMRKVDALIDDPQLALASVACEGVCGSARPSAAAASSQCLALDTAGRLSFARCMRTHGVTKFPGPAADGAVSAAMVRARGIDMDSPAFVRAVAECLPPPVPPT